VSGLPPGTPLPPYVPPADDDDGPLDPIEQALVRCLAQAILRQMAEEAVARASTPADDGTAA
jgi:hypothetical protein